MKSQSHPAVSDITSSEASLHRFLHELAHLDPAQVDERATRLATSPDMSPAKLRALAVSLIDLTTLEGTDTPDTVRALCTKAVKVSVAAVCVYPDLVEVASHALQGTGIKVASVAGGFPAGRTFRDIKTSEARRAVENGAEEIDMVIDRGAMLDERYGRVFDDITAVKTACAPAHLKVILETGELRDYDIIHRASWLAMLAGADFIKTSTGKTSPAATLPATSIMIDAVAEFAAVTGTKVGVKPAGGIRTSEDAYAYLTLAQRAASEEWLTPDLFRIGASSLLDNLLSA